MTDAFSWTNPNSIERKGIEAFLQQAERRAIMHKHIPLKKEEALSAISWMRGLLDRKPSEY